MKLSIEQLLLDSRIRIYAPVTQKWPMRPRLVDSIPFYIGDHNFFAAHRPLGNDFAALAKLAAFGRVHGLLRARMTVTDNISIWKSGHAPAIFSP